MANKSIKKLLSQLQDATKAQKDIEPLSDGESGELSGGTDINYGCPSGTPGINMTCPAPPAPQ